MIPELLLASPLDSAAQVAERFGLQTGYVVWQMISFATLATVLYLFGIRPTLKVMGERNGRIADGLRKADQVEETLRKAQAESAEVLRTASLEAQKLLAEARTAAKEFTDRSQAEASARANQMVERAKASIEQERERVMQEARTELTRLVVATTEKVLRQQMTDADRDRYTKAAARELAGV
jgi:F-type H+-transporting ATPase subunit b